MLKVRGNRSARQVSGREGAKERPGSPAAEKPGGWIPRPRLRQRPVEALVSHLSSKLDRALSFLDPSGPKPITLTGVTDRHFAEMEGKVASLEAGERPLTAKEKAALAQGKVLSEASRRADGSVEERTIGVVDLPLERFLKKVPAKDWGRHLADYKGGEVREAGPGRQVERMVLGAPGKDLDMTKVETVREERDSSGRISAARVRWEVLKSDNGSVAKDIGTVRFERFGEKTLVTWHSAHDLAVAPFSSPVLPGAVKDALLGATLSGYFSRAIEHYRAEAGAGS
ncbi:MAG: hypothetical protein HYZ28_20625 [Myxococcales bacterium]|nr:hypothetical protein [Myxococcales bacterium]